MATILIVEDSPAQAALIADIVTAAGHTAHKCLDPGTPVEVLVSTLAPHIVLLDLILESSDGRSVTDGFRLCRDIKRTTPNIPVVILSARDDTIAPEWAALQGADAFLQKPFTYTDLLATIDALIAPRSSDEGSGGA